MRIEIKLNKNENCFVFFTCFTPKNSGFKVLLSGNCDFVIL